MPRRISLFAAALFCGLWPQGAFAADASINVSGFSFVPANVTIDVGDKVTWSGLGTTHNVAQSDSALSNMYNLTGFRSGDVGDVTTYESTFNTPGIFYYICEPHAESDNMKGSVTVNAVGVPAQISPGSPYCSFYWQRHASWLCLAYHIGSPSSPLSSIFEPIP